VSGKKTVSYRWHLRRLMAEAGMFATTDMGPRLSARGITLSREQVYRLVTGVPERLSLPVLAALCDILDCGPGDLIEPVRKPARKEEQAPDPGPAARPRPVRARVIPGPGAR
jgi:DNA-binding Xre family transcriptional regulator